MDKEEKLHRLFIGIPLDAACQRQVDAGLADLQSNSDVRWVPPYNRHLTLALLGETRADILHQLQLQFHNAYEGQQAFAFLLNERVRFPDDRGHIIAAVNAPSVPLAALHTQTLVLVGRCGLPVEGRPFRPHVTLGRMRHPNRMQQEIRQPLEVQLQVERVCLYESLPTDEGRLYKVLCERVL